LDPVSVVTFTFPFAGRPSHRYGYVAVAGCRCYTRLLRYVTLIGRSVLVGSLVLRFRCAFTVVLPLVRSLPFHVCVWLVYRCGSAFGYRCFVYVTVCSRCTVRVAFVTDVRSLRLLLFSVDCYVLFVRYSTFVCCTVVTLLPFPLPLFVGGCWFCFPFNVVDAVVDHVVVLLRVDLLLHDFPLFGDDHGVVSTDCYRCYTFTYVSDLLPLLLFVVCCWFDLIYFFFFFCYLGWLDALFVRWLRCPALPCLRWLDFVLLLRFVTFVTLRSCCSFVYVCWVCVGWVLRLVGFLLLVYVVPFDVVVVVVAFCCGCSYCY